MTGDELRDFGERLRRDGPDFEADLGDLRAGGFDEMANLLYGCTLCICRSSAGCHVAGKSRYVRRTCFEALPNLVEHLYKKT